jgi:hypothetical protein
MKYCLRPIVSLFVLCFASSVHAQSVIINEIMYHPSSESPLEEYIELWNPNATNVNLTGWRLAGGVDFAFPSNTTIAANAYLVVAAHKARFQAKYAGVGNVVGDWIDVRVNNLNGYNLTNYLNVLSNTRNTVNVRDGNDQLVDTVSYADEGDWAVRQRGPDDFGRRGWIWYKEHDGLGKSLELVNPNVPNEYGQNWMASTTDQGTPGRVNSVFASNVAPLIVDARHQPAVPRSSDPILVSCRVLDESVPGVTVQLHWRVDSVTPPSFTINVMFDDGLHGDGVAGDGVYAATIPAQANNTVLEFFIRAADAQARERAWPAPAIDADDALPPRASLGQVANAIFQVDDDAGNNFGGVPSMQAVYKLIMTENERAYLAGIPCSGAQNSDAQMNATFIGLDAGRNTLPVRYSIAVTRVVAPTHRIIA